MITKVSNNENAESGLLPYPVIIAATKGDPEAMEIVVHHYDSYLGATECKLLAVLVKNAGQVLTRPALTDTLWEGGEELNENALSVTVSRLRGRLGEKSISTIYGLGYMWVGDRP